MKARWWKLWSVSALLLVAVTGCKKEDPPVLDLGYAYFPNNVGTFIEYEVDSTSWVADVSTEYNFFLREEYVETFIDNEGQLAMRVDRYKRTNASDPWNFDSSWSQKRTSTTAERIESNARYVRLVFPINSERSWDGNAYNETESWTHGYSSIGGQHIVNASFIFDDVVRVNQRNVSNLIDQEEAWEIYARDLGLVHKRFRDLSFATLELEGVDMEWRIVASGDL